MGVQYDDLDHHEGYAERRPGGYRATCSCGWTGSIHPPTERGQERAIDAWDVNHARPLLETAVPMEVREVLANARRLLAKLATDRPRAALSALAEVHRWADALSSAATSAARGLDQSPRLTLARTVRKRPELGL